MGTRLSVLVRDAVREDAEALISIWRANACPTGAAGDESPAANPMWREPGIEESVAAVDLHLDNPERRLLVALVDGTVVGVLACSLRSLTPIHLTRVLIVTDLEVMAEWRRKSVASSLLSAAAHWGEEMNCDVVLTISPASSREPNRFLARLGFGQVSTVRAAQISVVRSRFAAKATNSRDTGRLIAMRRTLRRRQDTRVGT